MNSQPLSWISCSTCKQNETLTQKVTTTSAGADSLTGPDLFESPAEPLKHPLHVATFLHGDDPGVVLLVDPDQEGLLVVVPEENRPRELNKELSGDGSC